MGGWTCGQAPRVFSLRIEAAHSPAQLQALLPQCERQELETAARPLAKGYWRRTLLQLLRPIRLDLTHSCLEPPAIHVTLAQPMRKVLILRAVTATRGRAVQAT